MSLRRCRGSGGHAGPPASVYCGFPAAVDAFRTAAQVIEAA
jgi:hypothetical protein